MVDLGNFMTILIDSDALAN